MMATTLIGTLLWLFGSLLAGAMVFALAAASRIGKWPLWLLSGLTTVCLLAAIGDVLGFY